MWEMFESMGRWPWMTTAALIVLCVAVLLINSGHDSGDE